MPPRRQLHVWLSDEDYEFLSAYAAARDERVVAIVRRLIRQLRVSAARVGYVRSRRYAAVVNRLKGLARAGKTVVPSRSPIGFLPGDEVTPDDEQIVAMMGGESCGEFCAGQPDGTPCPDEGVASCSVDRCQSGTCAHAEVTPAAPHSPDPYPLDTENLTAGTQSALACLQQAVAAAGGTFALTSTYRPQSYQDHLREVWDKWQLICDWVETECLQVTLELEIEWDRHDLVFRPAQVSPHTSGTAFDATVTLPPGPSVDALANGCGLSRPAP